MLGSHISLIVFTITLTLAGAVPVTADATGNVSWTPCGDGFDCTTISAPLDWSNTSDARTVNLAVGRYKATQEPYLGVIWYNPGGPGDSGSGEIYSAGPLLNLATNGQYDIISWDPRGVNASSPNLTCFDTSLNQYLFQVTSGIGTQNLDLPASFGGDPSALSVDGVYAEFEEQLARKKASLAALWNQCVEKSGDIAAFMGTASVVRDLDHMSKVISGSDTRINYYGISYGSLLGQFLSVILPPSRLGRIVIDGIANADVWQDYPTSQLTTPSYADADATIKQGFERSCASAGAACALSSLGSATVIVDAIHSLIDQLYFSPVQIAPSIYPSGSVKPQYVRALLFEVAYAPTLWATAAVAFAEAISGNYSLLLELIAPSPGPSLVSQASESATYAYSVEAVMCNDWLAYDAAHPPPTTKESAQLIRHNLEHVSGSMGDSLYLLMFCDLWPSKSKSRYEGTLKLAKQALKTPILILTNTWDPVTPRLGALTALQNLGMTNSRLVEQNGTGHTTFLSGASVCVQQIVSLDKRLLC
ncbi:hypothetical protein RQP46_001727 [Phenoliferia psychrophenolica]